MNDIDTTRREEANTMEEIRELASVALRRVQRADLISPRLFDISNAANYLSMSDKGIRELISSGELPYIQKIPGRSPYLIDKNELDAWIERNKRTALK